MGLQRPIATYFIGVTMRLTKKQAEKEFREVWKSVLEYFPNYKGDVVAKREEWFIFIDNLLSERKITFEQYNSWQPIC